MRIKLFKRRKEDKLHDASNMLVMTIAFLVLGLFISVVTLTQTALRYLENQAQITIFFQDDFVEENILSLKQNLENDVRVQEVKYVSKEDAFKIFTEMNKDEKALLESVTASILPASLEVKVKNIVDLSQLSEEFSSFVGVEEVRYFKDVIETFRFWSSTAYIVGFVLVGIFLLVSYSVVVSTIRSRIHMQGPELEIMRLVGASKDYLRAPFVRKGLLYGLVSSTIASSVYVLAFTVSFVSGLLTKDLAFGFIHSVSVNPIIFSVCLAIILILSGGLLGYLGSTIALKKYLKF